MKILFKLVISKQSLISILFHENTLQTCYRQKGLYIFSSKCTQNRLSAGVCPDPLGELQRSPDSVAGFKGAYF